MKTLDTPKAGERTQHTPGPWDFDTDDLATWINSPSIPQPIAKMGGSRALPTLANARLIAAAPKMYSFVASKADSGDAEAIQIIKEIDNATDPRENNHARLGDSELCETNADLLRLPVTLAETLAHLSR